MKLSLLQMDVIFKQPEKNRSKVEKMVQQAMESSPDVLVLPEMWNVGFFPDNVQELADNEGEPSCSLLEKLAKKYNVNIVGGSIANKENGELVNTNYVFNRKGELIAKYNKIHLFSPSGEDKYFTPGTGINTYELDGIKAAAIICYDLRFVELVRMLAIKGIQILFIPAQWPHPRLEHWKTLVKARAIENQMFVAAVNGVGTADNLKFCGNSMLVDPWGEVLVNGGETEGIYSAEIDLAVIKDIRERINVFRDRKPLVYN